MLSLTKWCEINKLTINLDKCSYIILKNPQNKFLFNHSNLLLNNKPIKFANQVTFLGVKINSNLNWSRDISDLLSQLRPLGGLLYQSSQYLPKSLLLTLYNSYIHSKLNYCIEAWGNAPLKYLNKVFLFQKKIIRIIHKKPFDHSSAELFKVSKVLTVFQIFKFKILLKAHSSFYTPTNHSHSTIHTRHSQLSLPLPPSKTAAGHRRNVYQESALWNDLPRRLRELRCPTTFRRELKLYLLD